MCYPHLWLELEENLENSNSLYVFQLILTLIVQCISESCIKITINLNFYFHILLWCLRNIRAFFLIVRDWDGTVYQILFAMSSPCFLSCERPFNNLNYDYISVILIKTRLFKLISVSQSYHCMKSTRIQSFSYPYSAAFGLKTDQKNSEYEHSLRSVCFRPFNRNEIECIKKQLLVDVN